MTRSTSQLGQSRTYAALLLLAGLAALLALTALPARAAAAPCPVNPGNATTWIGGSGSIGDSANWSNGTPTGTCDVTITPAGSPTITMTGGINVRSLVLGGTGSTPQLVISDQSPNTNLDAQPAGISIAAGASVTLTCPPPGENCGPDIYSGSSPFLNAGTITVDSGSGTGSVVGGAITNTGTIRFEKSGSLSGVVVNKGSILVSDGATVTNSGSSCADTGAAVKNDTGGLIDGGATGVLSARNFEQGAGVTRDVTIPCGGTLSYTGGGASEIRATGGFNLIGQIEENQALTVSAESSNTIVSLGGDVTNEGSITLTCPAAPGECSGGSGGGAGFNVAGHEFTNAGEFTVAADSGTGASIDSGSGGTTLNTGTMNFEQSAFLRGVTVNKGAIEIAVGEVVTAPAESCGDTAPRVVNDTGGSINAAAGGFLSVINYEQGNGTTSGSVPVRIPCGTLKYTGTGASSVQANAAMTGDIAAGQTLRVRGQVSTPAFANAGTIVLDQSTGDATLAGGTVTNTGRIEVSGPSVNTAQIAGGEIHQTGAGAEVVVPAGTKLNPGGMLKLAAGTLRGAGTVTGTVGNSGGVVKPGDGGIGTLTVTGSYVQDLGRLEIEVGGLGAGEHDVLAVGGVLGVNGALALIPTGGFAASAAIGDSFPFLAYNDFGLGGQFASVSVDPALSCGKTFAASDDAGAKQLKATVVAGGTPCPAVAIPPAAAPPVPAPAPRKTCPKGKQLKKGKCVRKKCPKGKKLKRGRCVKKHKARSKRS